MKVDPSDVKLMLTVLELSGMSSSDHMQHVMQRILKEDGTAEMPSADFKHLRRAAKYATNCILQRITNSREVQQ